MISDEYNDVRHYFFHPLDFLKQSGQTSGLLRNASPCPERVAKGQHPSADVLAGTVIVYPPTIDWGFMKQRPQQLMQQFANHGHQVFYCNKTQSEDRVLEQVQPNLTVVHKNKAFIQNVVPALKRQGNSILLWVSWSKLHLFLDQYLPDFIVYDYVDDIPAWGPYLPKMVERADIIITTAGILKNQIDRMFPGKPNYLIPNGCDVRHFQKFASDPPEKPIEYQGHSGPIIGYIGAWAYWIDHDLVREITRAFPEALFSVIGVEYGVTVDRSIPNLVYLGQKPYEVLPQYLFYHDVCVIPFKISQITVATNPIKMYEYLAAGKPVVATDLPEVRSIPYVFIGEDNASFVDHIRRLLSSPAVFSRDEVNGWLAAQTWEERYRSIIRIFSEDDHFRRSRTAPFQRAGT